MQGAEIANEQLDKMDWEIMAKQLANNTSMDECLEPLLDDPIKTYNEVNLKYQSFDYRNLESTQEQLYLYKSSRVNDEKLPISKRAEANRQWAYCLFTELSLRRTQTLENRETNKEYSENKEILKSCKEKLEYAKNNGDETTIQKAKSFLEKVDKILNNYSDKLSVKIDFLPQVLSEESIELVTKIFKSNNIPIGYINKITVRSVSSIEIQQGKITSSNIRSLMLYNSSGEIDYEIFIPYGNFSSERQYIDIFIKLINFAVEEKKLGRMPDGYSDLLYKYTSAYD